MILLDHSISVVKGAAKNNKFQKTKLINNKEKLDLTLERNNAHKLTIKLYQINV
jgi:hypothetical protein